MTGPDGAALHGASVPAIGAAATHGHATHDELVAAVAALLAVARSRPVRRPAAERTWRSVRLAALGLAPRR